MAMTLPSYLVVALCFTLAALVLSVQLIYKHIAHFSAPSQQRYIIRILCMVCVYSIDSFAALAAPSIAPYLDLARDTYEAYVLYSFYALLGEYLGGEVNVVHTLSLKQTGRWTFPLKGTFRINRRILSLLKLLVLQFVFVKPTLSFTAVAMSLTGTFHEGSFSPSAGYLYVTLFDNTSISISMWALIQFYQISHRELVHHRPLFKFLAIKFVIFMTFWQSVLIALLVAVGVVRGSEDWSSHEVATSLQDFLVCLEMFVAALFHLFAFDFREFAGGPVLLPFWERVAMAFRLWDVVEDTHRTIRGMDPVHEVSFEMTHFLAEAEDPLEISSHVDHVDTAAAAATAALDGFSDPLGE